MVVSRCGLWCLVPDQVWWVGLGDRLAVSNGVLVGVSLWHEWGDTKKLLKFKLVAGA